MQVRVVSRDTRQIDTLKGTYDILSTKHTSSITIRLANALEVILKILVFSPLSAAKSGCSLCLST